ncbi:hypothetical protein [Phytopseudomonas dryadis]|uniref:hypothetical protein n=1 Tax=Pseudomonadaceae TaxID=135621 RepID=UPI0013F15613|nr:MULTISPECIES: hypothetical protein [Pseudomonas]
MSIPATRSSRSKYVPALRRRPPVPERTALPRALAFWALWHCRHARPPDSAAVPI